METPTNKSNDSGLLTLFLNESFRAIAVSFLTIFSGVFIYKTVLETGHGEKYALVSVALYFFGLYFFKLISHILAEDVCLKAGIKTSISLGQVFLILCVIFLFLAGQNLIFIALSSIFFGLAAGFYWTGYHGLLSKMSRPLSVSGNNSENRFGNQIGLAGAINNLFLLIVPFLGGVLISLFGYPGLFFGSFLFIVFSLIISVPLENEKTHNDTSLKEIFTLFKTQKTAFWGHFGHSFASAIYGTIFPLYIFFIFNKELSLGGFFTLSMALSALINFFVGKWIDKKGFGRPLALGSIVSSLVWIGRGLTKNSPLLFFLEIADRLTAPMTGIPIDVITYEKALEDKARGRAILFREVALGLGALFACLVVLGIVLSGFSFESSFFVAALFSLFSLLLISK